MTRRAAFSISGVICLAAFAVGAWAYSRVPSGALIPSHFDAQGHVNGYSGPWVLFLMPLMTAGFIGLMLLVLKVEPRRQHIMESAAAVNAIVLGFSVLMLLVQLVIAAGAVGGTARAAALSAVIPAGVGALFVVIGVYLPRVQSNFFVGIRTPWTLSSEVAWHKTHAVGGPAFVLLGLAMMATAFFPTVMTAVLIVGTLGVALGLSVYSYFAWRSDPDKHMV